MPKYAIKGASGASRQASMKCPKNVRETCPAPKRIQTSVPSGRVPSVSRSRTNRDPESVEILGWLGRPPEARNSGLAEFRPLRPGVPLVDRRTRRRPSRSPARRSRTIFVRMHWRGRRRCQAIRRRDGASFRLRQGHRMSWDRVPRPLGVARQAACIMQSGPCSGKWWVAKSGPM